MFALNRVGVGQLLTDMPAATRRRQRPLDELEHAVCDEVFELRRRMSLSQTQFARTVGTSPRSVNRWESHRFCPTRLRLYRLRELQHMMDNLDLRDRTIDGRYFPLDFSPNGEGGRFGSPGPPRRG